MLFSSYCAHMKGNWLGFSASRFLVGHDNTGRERLAGPRETSDVCVRLNLRPIRARGVVMNGGAKKPLILPVHQRTYVGKRLTSNTGLDDEEGTDAAASGAHQDRSKL